MLVRFKDSIAKEYYEFDVMEVVKPGGITKAFIHERENGSGEWYLVDCGVLQSDIYNGKNDSKITRLYVDPEFPEDFKNGPYIWVNAKHCEPFYETNRNAKRLLKEFEWRV